MIVQNVMFCEPFDVQVVPMEDIVPVDENEIQIIHQLTTGPQIIAKEHAERFFEILEATDEERTLLKNAGYRIAGL